MDGRHASTMDPRVEGVREYIADMALQLAKLAAGIGDVDAARALTVVAEGYRTARGGTELGGPH